MVTNSENGSQNRMSPAIDPAKFALYQHYRDALEEERRAEKALFLLKARDRRIAYLEKRVAELDKTAASLHAISLRSSSTFSNVNGPDEDASYEIARSEKSGELNDDDVSVEVINGDSIYHDFDQDRRFVSDTPPRIPRLNLSKSSTTSSNKEVFSSAAIEAIRGEFADETRISNRTRDLTGRSDRSVGQEEKNLASARGMEANEINNETEKIPIGISKQITTDPSTGSFIDPIEPIDDKEDTRPALLKSEQNRSSDAIESNEKKIRVIFHTEQHKSNTSTSISHSVPRIPVKHIPSKRIKGLRSKNGHQQEPGAGFKSSDRMEAAVVTT
ncbi:hypothetical protein KM043_016187 [Ampulex compressa]|nr:hypothetical protein KM043_016187 [Ampulex compressa]